MDDDVWLSHDDMALLYQLWLAHPQQLVGPWHVARHYNHSTGVYGTAQIEYNLLLTTCTVLHRRYLELYMSPLLARARAYVEQQTNGEDILMNFVVADVSQLPPVAAHVNLQVRQLGRGCCQPIEAKSSFLKAVCWCACGGLTWLICGCVALSVVCERHSESAQCRLRLAATSRAVCSGLRRGVWVSAAIALESGACGSAVTAVAHAGASTAPSR